MTPAGRARELEDRRRDQVRAQYGRLASGHGTCCSVPCVADSCGSAVSGCCDASTPYPTRELAGVPAGADLGLGCGNPLAQASLRTAETVVDLGSGAGIDCFLAARKVGRRGRVIGVDMTPEMISRARDHARRGKVRNVEFRLGEIEHLPVADACADVVISNCVVNLAPDKGQVYDEAFRVLRPGGRLVLADVVATRPITPSERADPDLWSSCASGALHVGEVRRLLRRAGFERIRVRLPRPPSAPRSGPALAGSAVVAAEIAASKPGG